MTAAPEHGQKPQAGKSFEQVKKEEQIRRDIVIDGVTYRVTVHGKTDCFTDVQEKLLGLLKIHTTVIATEPEMCYNEDGSIGLDLQKERGE